MKSSILKNINPSKVKDLAFQNYTIHGADRNEFNKDYRNIKCLKQSYNNYIKCKKININLTLNRVIILFNVFPTDFCRELLFYHFNNLDQYKFLNSFLMYTSFHIENKNYNDDIVEKINKALNNQRI